MGDEISLKAEVGDGSAIGSVIAAEPVEEVKQFLDEAESVLFGDVGRVVDGDVPHLVNGANLWEESRLQIVLKGLLVDEGSEAIVVGELEVGVISVEPVNGLL